MLDINLGTKNLGSKVFSDIFRTCLMCLTNGICCLYQSGLIYSGGCAHVGKTDCTDGSGCKTDCDGVGECANGEDESSDTCKYPYPSKPNG